MTTTTYDGNGDDVTTWAGYRRHTMARTTGALVVVIDQYDGWIDDVEHENRWACVCDRHSTLCTWPTRRAAESYMAHPEDWCEPCRDGEPAPSDDDDHDDDEPGTSPEPAVVFHDEHEPALAPTTGDDEPGAVSHDLTRAAHGARLDTMTTTTEVQQ